MAEPQLPLNQEELNQEEFKPNVAEIIGYNKDMFKMDLSSGDILEINPTQPANIINDGTMNWKQKDAVSSLNSISTITPEKVVVDKYGNIDVSPNTGDDVGIMMNQKFDDYVYEDKRVSIIEDINQKKDKELEDLNIEADNKIASGELKQSRREKYIDKNKKLIEDKYKKESSDRYLELYYEANDNKDKIPGKFRRRLRKLQRNIDNLSRRSEALGAGNPKTMDDIIAQSVDPTFHENYLNVKARGIADFAQFKNDYINGGGNVKEGDVWLGYVTFGKYIDNDPYENYSKPVYFTATVDADGNRHIHGANPGFVHPVTKEIIGAYKPPTDLANIIVNADYSAIVNYSNNRKKLKEKYASGEISEQELVNLGAELNSKAGTAIRRNLDAYDKIMSSDKYSIDVKMAVIASVFPNDFEEKYQELLEAHTKDKSAFESAMTSLFQIGTLGPRLIGAVAGGAATGVDNLVQWYLDKDDVEFPMGTLALEIYNNPELAIEMDSIIKKMGRRKSTYTSSVNGLFELTKAARLSSKDRALSATASFGDQIVSDTNELITELNDAFTTTELELKNFTNGRLDIFNNSGYTEALNSANRLQSLIENSVDENIKNAYKFLSLKQKVINYDGSGNPLSTLTNEEINFINTVGADLTKNNPELLNNVIVKINEVAKAFKWARSLYPTKKLAEYDNKNKAKVDELVSSFNAMLKASEDSPLFSTENADVLDMIQAVYSQYGKEDDLANYFYPLMSMTDETPAGSVAKLALQGTALPLSAIKGLSDILRGVESTANIAIGDVEFDKQKVYLSSSLNSYKRHLEVSIPETGIYYVDMASKIGSALPQMAAFVGSFVAGGPAGGAAYLGATMTGEKMEEAANAGCDPVEQMFYAGLSIGIEYASELVTSETGLLGVRGGKSVLTKSLLGRIMNTRTRKEALKEYAGLIWKTSKNVVKSGGLESFEEQVSDKANYILQNMFNSTLSTTFDPSVMGFQESFDNLLVMTATGALFKGGTSVFNIERPSDSKLKKDLTKQGMSSDDATLIAGISSTVGLKRAIDFVDAVESGEISSQSLNTEKYSYLKNKLIPNAMMFQSQLLNFNKSNISVQQRTVALYNMMQINEVESKVESGEIPAASAEVVVAQLQENANKALEDKEFADNQFGLDDTGLAQKIKEYMGIYTIETNEDGLLDASINAGAVQEGAVAEATTTPAVEGTIEGAVEGAVTPTVSEEEASNKSYIDAKLADAQNAAISTSASGATTASPSQLIEQATDAVQSEAVAEMASTPVTPVAETIPARVQQAAQESGFEVLTRTGLAEKLISLVAAPIRKNISRRNKERLINSNPEKAIATEIYSTRALIDIAKDKYEQALSIRPTAGIELAQVRLLTDKLNKLVALKDNYIKTQQYATEISQGLQQEVAKRGSIEQYQGAQEGQLEEGERERRRREDAQSSANYRNSNFGGQAQQAAQEIASLPERSPILNNYIGSMQPGQEVQLMDEIAAKVVTNEGAAIRQFGQPVVDRAKQYISDTNFTTDLPVVKQAMVREAENRVSQSMQEATTVIERQNQNTSKKHKKAVGKLVERLKQAFPNVKVFMDKKGFEAAMQDPAARELMTKGGVVYGRILNGDVYLNPDFSNYNTPIHEFGHLWLNVAKESFPNIYNRGLELIRDSEYVTQLEADPLYNGLTKEELEEEALATAIGDKGEQLIFESQRKSFRGWMTRLLRKMAQYVGIMNMSSSELRSLDLDTYLNMVNASLLAGEPITVSREGFTEMFMARMDNDVKNALTKVAQEHFNLAIARGLDLETSRTEAFDKVLNFVTGTYFNKSNFQEIVDGLADIVFNVSESQRQRVIEQKKTEKLNQLFRFPEIQAIATSANEEALRLAQGKVKASDAITQVTGKVKAEIEALFAGNKAPAGVSWINVMSLAPSIAADSVMAAFPATNRSTLLNEDIVTMTSSKYIRNAIFNQINAIKDVRNRAEGIKEAVKEIFKQMSDTYGKGLQLSTSKINTILSEIQSNVFSREDIMSATEEAANAVSNIIEKEYKKKLIDESNRLIERLKTKASKAKYVGDVFNKTMSLISANTGIWKESNVSLENLSEINTALGKILAGDNSQLDYAINKIAEIEISNDSRVNNEFDSLMAKMDRLIAKGGNLDLSDYAAIMSFSNALQDVKARKDAEAKTGQPQPNIGSLSAFTLKQLQDLEGKYSSVIASIPGSLSLNEIIAQKEAEITNTAQRKALLLSGLLQEDTSDIRMKVKNPVLYHQMISFSKFILQEDYIDSISTNDKLSLIDAIDNIMTYGNYNYDVYIQYIKAKKYHLKTNTIGWARNLAKNRRALTSPGLTGMVVNKFKNFVRVFTDVEGATPSANLIADNFDLLRLASMDIELFNGRGKSGYDIFDMGFLEREIFAPMASGVDGSVNRTQAKLENLQTAMILLGDKSNRNVIKKAIKGLRQQYGTSGALIGKRIGSMFKRGSSDNLYVDISTRMTAIIAHQIDHISNLKEGQVADDMILKRNILDGIEEKNKAGMTMADRYGKLGGIATLDYDKILDAIAYSALTDNGTTTLEGLSQEKLLSKLTASQKSALNSWREFIEANQSLTESSMVFRGNMRALIKNYFPRVLSSSENVTSIQDYDSYMNSQVDNVGLSENQIMGRTSNVGRISLNGNRVLLNNLKSLHLLNEMQPYMDYIKGIGEAIKELKDMAAKESDEAVKRELNFAAAYAEGIEITIKRRLDNSLLNGDKSLNSNFNLVFKAIAKTQKFAANMWLISTARQLGADYPANIIKTSAALAYANKSAKLQTWKLLSPTKSSVRTKKGKFYWEDYVKIAELTGSPVYRTVSMYSDNFLYDYSKTPKQAQRQQKVMSWQDMAVKKQAWMERFENAFERLTGEAFDHAEFQNERGSYRAMFLDAVETASKAADSTIDRQFGLPSFARQPLRVNPLPILVLGRPLRHLLNMISDDLAKYITIPKNNPFTFITGFMMGYPSIQASLFRNYMKLAFSGTSGLSIKQRSKYMSQAINEAFIPTLTYGITRTFFGWLMASAAQVAYSASGDEEEKEAIMKEMEGRQWWERQLKKFKIQMNDSEEEIINNIINSLSTNVIDPQQTYTIKMIGGLMLFQFWKKQAVIAMDKNRPEEGVKLSKQQSQKYKDERALMGRKIKQSESWWWHLLNIKPIEIYGGKDYENAVRKYDIGWAAGAATKGWEELFESIGGFSEVHKAISSSMTAYDLWETLEKGEGKVNKDELLLASIMKGYALIFANFMIGGKYAWVARLFSGDANKLSNAILKDLEEENYRFLEQTEEEEKKRKKQNTPSGRKKGPYGKTEKKGPYGGTKKKGPF